MKIVDWRFNLQAQFFAVFLLLIKTCLLTGVSYTVYNTMYKVLWIKVE